MTNSLPTRGQLERELSQRVQGFYRDRLGKQPSKVTCQIFGSKLAIIIESSITDAEKLLVEEGKEDLAGQVRLSLDDAIKPELKQLIEKSLLVEVIDLLSDAALDTERTGIIAILSDVPQVRNPESIPKIRLNKKTK